MKEIEETPYKEISQRSSAQDEDITSKGYGLDSIKSVFVDANENSALMHW